MRNNQAAINKMFTKDAIYKYCLAQGYPEVNAMSTTLGILDCIHECHHEYASIKEGFDKAEEATRCHYKRRFIGVEIDGYTKEKIYDYCMSIGYCDHSARATAEGYMQYLVDGGKIKGSLEEEMRNCQERIKKEFQEEYV